MAYVNGNKPIITNGLVYALDFGNTKSYNSGSNTARSMVFDPAGTTAVTGSTAIPVLTNGVLNFTGSQFVRRTGSLDSIDPNGAFTISLVAKSNTVGSLLTQNLTGKIFQIQSTPSSSNIGFNLGTGTYSRTIPGFNSSSLQHISFRYNSGSIDTFLNGIPVTSSIANASLRPTGQLNALFFSSGSNSFSGSLANLYVYNRSLTPDEIYENYLVMAGRYGLPVVPKPYSIDENLYQWIQSTGTTDTDTISAISTFISGLKSNGLWNKIQTIYPFVGTTTGSQTINLKEPGIYRLSLTGSFSASNAGLYPSSSTSYVDSIPGNTVHPLVNSASAHLSLLSYDTPAGNGFLGGNSLPALGGEIIARSGSKVYHAFTTVGTSSFIPLTNVISNVEVMVVAGGGGGASLDGAGGGAGGLIYSSSFLITPGAAIQVIVGAGGVTSNPGQNGQNSLFGSITATGGGGGGTNSVNGQNGGSGGGGGHSSNSGSGILGQGFDGGGSPGFFVGGGGGGAGQKGGDRINTTTGGHGGSGSYYPQFISLGGSPVGWFAGGGAGSIGFNVRAFGGPGGGGNGGGSSTFGPTATSGVPNTGGGGGGSKAGQAAGNGGSGIVIVGYDIPSDFTAITGSGTGLYLTETSVTGSVNNQFTAGITGSGTIGFLTVSRTGSGVFSIHKNNVSQSITSAASSSLPTDIFFNTANLAGSGSLPLQANLAYASIGAGLTTSEVATYYNLVSQLQTNLKRQNTLLDNYSGAAAAYSLRRIGPSGYFGPAIRVRRDSDNTLRDIGFTSDGQLDTVGLLDFVGVTGSGFVQTWYDQSGNNNNASQATNGNQPLAVSSGSIPLLNSKPAIQSSSTLKRLDIPNISYSQAYISVIFNRTGKIGPEDQLYGFLQAPNNQLYASGNSWILYSNAVIYSTTIPVNTSQKLITQVDDGTNTLFYDNSNLNSTFATSRDITNSTLQLFAYSTSYGTLGNIQEFILYTSSQATTRAAIESAQNTNYKIYGSATASFDPDYQAFITATGITEPTQSAALETLVSDLKSYGLWSKMKAIYPMVTDKNNRFAQSEDFSLTWNAVSSSVTVNQITAPNGISTADLIREEAGTGDHYVYQTVDTLASGNEYVLSVYGRFLNRPWIALQTNDGAQSWFNLQTGVTGSFTGSRATITSVSGGWYRCALFYTASSAGAKNQHIHLADANGNYNYTGVATTGSYLWGAQFENGNVLGPYRATTATGFTTGSMFDQMKFNLKNPADTDAAFRLTYSGSWNPGYSGVKGDGVTAYADTKLNVRSNYSASNLSFGSYWNDYITNNSNKFYGAHDGGGIAMVSQKTTIISGDQTGYIASFTGISATQGSGLHILSRISPSQLLFYRNTTKAAAASTADFALPNLNFWLGGVNGLTSFGYIQFNYAFSFLSEGLTDYQAKALYWIVQKFQTTLGRQVY
jgi:hypothetical protein